MKKYKVFIDGSAGTTGLKIRERFRGREDIELLSAGEETRKDTAERKKLINESEFTFLCLPDDAAKESAALCENPNVRIIDASTAHRINPDWAYGLPEISREQREKIKNSKRVSVPGCYASGFISLVYPLTERNVIPGDYPLTCHAVSGYSGAGKNAIAEYEGENKPESYNSPRFYALGLTHKHIPEMQKMAGIKNAPIFCPVICDYYSGMLVSVPLYIRNLTKPHSAEEIKGIMKEHYKGQKLIKVSDAPDFLPGNYLSGKEHMEIYVTGNSEQILLTACFDNLGKGASGAAVQCMNIMMGIDETTGLI